MGFWRLFPYQPRHLILPPLSYSHTPKRVAIRTESVTDIFVATSNSKGTPSFVNIFVKCWMNVRGWMFTTSCSVDHATNCDPVRTGSWTIPPLPKNHGLD